MRPAYAHAYIAAGLVPVALYFTQDGLAAEAIRLTITVSSIVAVIIGVRVNRPRNAGAWRLAVLAVLCLLAMQVCWLFNVIDGEPVEGTIGNLFGAASFLTFVGSVVLVVRHRTRRDAGGVLDAAVLAVASGTVIWEFLMYSKLLEHDSGAVLLAVKLIQLLCIMGGLGVLLRLAQTSTGSTVSLFYMFGVVFGGFVRIVGATVISTSPVFEPGGWTDAGSPIALLCLGAAALHPSMTTWTEPGPHLDDRLSTRRLWLLAAAMVAGPLSVGTFLLAGGRADTVLLVVGSITIVPLVMLRIRGLVAQRETAEAALAHQARHDSLTSLPNRAQFVGRLDETLDRLRAGRASTVAVVFCDLDGFKTINDALGHAAGDRVLKTVAERLRECVRDRDLVSRFGGDEFLILCQDLAEAEVVDRIADRISVRLNMPIALGGTTVMVTASVGVAAADAGEELTAEELIRDADMAMYAAKQSSASAPTRGGGPAAGRISQG